MVRLQQLKTMLTYRNDLSVDNGQQQGKLTVIVVTQPWAMDLPDVEKPTLFCYMSRNCSIRGTVLVVERAYKPTLHAGANRRSLLLLMFFCLFISDSCVR